jgi:hypothetical protein
MWLASVRAQVVKQYRAIQADPSKNGFTAAFTSPMLITGGAKIFTIYASKEVFNGEIILRISTDGKILVIGKLNFAADNLSITGRLYADLSKIAAGEATILFLADIPDQVQLLTIDGRFKMVETAFLHLRRQFRAKAAGSCCFMHHHAPTRFLDRSHDSLNVEG